MLVSGLPAAGPLALDWSRDLDGEVAGQPLVIGDTVVAATEADTVYGLSRTSGAVLWRTSVGTPLPLSQQPCGNLNPLGITSTPVYDPATGLVYVVAQDGRTRHVLAGLRLTDGKVMVSRDIPAPDHQAAFDQQRGALALADGHVYVVFGGHYGDCGPYVGSVVAIPASGRGAISSYLVPTTKQGGIWAAPAGRWSARPARSTSRPGTAAGSRRPFDGSDSVIALTPQLQRTGVFAPTDWRTLSADDLDLGSTGPALLADGQILQVGKSGVGYLLDAAHLGGVGGQIAASRSAWHSAGPRSAARRVYVPCISGLAAVDTAQATSCVSGGAARPACRGSPVLGGGALLVPLRRDTGVLYELNPGNGRVRHQLKVAGKLPHFVSPALSGRLVLVGTMTGVAAVSGA